MGGLRARCNDLWDALAVTENFNRLTYDDVLIFEARHVETSV